MMRDEYMVRSHTYIQSLGGGLPPWLDKIEQEARAAYIPLVRKETQGLLRVLLCVKRPVRVLEIGTAVGFSALLMSLYLPEDGQIWTMECDRERIAAARGHFREAHVEERIHLLEGDALQLMREIDGTYDFVFLDAAKGQYVFLLPEILRVMPAGGVLVADNILREGDVLESRFAIERRNRTIHKRMREFLYEVTHSPELDTTLLEEGDGVAVCVKI